jgi:hypothetical protein
MGSEYYDRPYNLVKDQISSMAARADDALQQAKEATAALADLPSPLGGVLPPQFTLPDDTLPNRQDLDAPDKPILSLPAPMSIPVMGDGSELLEGLALTVDDVPTFVPPITQVNIPDSPAAIDTSGVPEAPPVNLPTVPDAPTITLPEVGAMLAVSIPTFVAPTMPTFGDTAPVWAEVAPSVELNWTETPYESDLFDTLKARVTTMLGGGTGLTPAVESALFDRARVRVDQDGERAVDQAFSDWAARGFEMPPGMLVEQVNSARETARLAAGTIARDILVQAATWEIENLRFAVTNGIALEAQLTQRYLALADRMFQAARYRVEADIALYNAKATVFNAMVGAYEAKARVFETRIRAALAEIEGFKAQVEAQQAIGQLNEQTVKIFTARVQAVSTQIEIYKGQVAGVQAFADVEKTKIDGYRARVQAYAERVGAEKSRFDAFKSQVEGEAAKVGLLEASARAFAATIEGYKAKSDVKVSIVNARAEGLRAAVAEFAALIAAERDRVGSGTDIVRAQVAEYSADIDKYRAELSDVTEQRRVDVTRVESRLRNNLAYYEIQVKEFDSSLARLLEEMKVRVEALKTIAASTSQLAAGAFAAMHVSAGMSGSAGVTDAYQRVDQYRFDGSA